MLYTKEQKAVKIRSRLENHLDEFVELLASGQKVTLVPSRTSVKAFAGRETRLDFDSDRKSVGGGSIG